MLRAYRVTQFDKGLVEIAARFHVPDVRAILEQNADIFPTGAEEVNVITPSLVGQILQIPFPDDYDRQWDWGTHVARAGESLAAVCAKMNRDPRIDPRRLGAAIGTPPWLTPEYLLNLFENANVRGGHGADAKSVSLAAGEVVNVPFPRVASRSRVIATSHALSTAFEIEPAWIIELTNQIEAFSGQARRLEPMIVALREVQREGLREANRLVGMQRVMEILKAHPAKPRQLLTSEFSDLAPVERALDALRGLATDKLFTNILQVERAAAYDATLSLGRSLLATLRSPDLHSLAQRLCKEANRYPRVVNELCAALAYAYEVLGDSPLEDEAMTDVDACVRYVAGRKPVSGDAFAQVDPALARAIPRVDQSDLPATTLGSMTSLVRNLGGAVTASVGNLPGPSTLSVALYRLWGLRVASKAVAAATRTTTTTVVTTETAVLIRFARNAFAADAAEGDEILIAIAEVRLTAAFTKTAGPPPAFRSQVLERYSGAMSAPRWSAGLAITGVIVLVFSVSDMIQKGEVNATDGLAATGGMASTALGAVQLFARLEASAMKGIGRGAAGLGIVLSLAGWMADEKAGADTTADKLSTAGSLLLGLSLVELAAIPEPFSPVLAAAGGLLVVAGIAYSVLNDDAVRDYFRTGTKKWFLGQARSFMLGPHATAQAAALHGGAKALEDAILSADFFAVDVGQRAALGRLLSSRQEIDMLIGD
ncbi:MAG: hypothetical protein M3O50_06615 [Myxococcota bacterium]|nr:hypothetical protein [Myxococcota bacterium]